LRRGISIEAERDLRAIFGDSEGPRVLNVKDLLALEAPEPSTLIEGLIPSTGATLFFAAPKAGKSVVSVQLGIAVASGHALFDYYRTRETGPVLMIPQDDPAGAVSVTQIIRRSPVPVDNIPFHVVPRVQYTFGDPFIEWLEAEIRRLSVRLCILDSYTSLRGPRSSNDFVKAEQTDLTMLDELGKRNNCAVVVIHHSSRGAAGLDWTSQAAGSFAMSMAVEAQIHMARYPELDGNAPERLVRVRGRHIGDTEMVLRFRKETLDFEHVLEGGAASLYPLMLQIRTEFGCEPFTPKEFTHRTGAARATAHRHINRLFSAGVLIKRGYGEYAMSGGNL
jgi:hypothetical protein